MRLLAFGVAVSRTASDLVRYHDKLIIIDRRVMYVLSFNFTHLDIDHSRGFGIVTTKVRFVREAVKLFEADTMRQPYVAGLDGFIVSPVNARRVLAGFIRKARKQLFIYDPLIADPEMLRALNARAKAGVEIRIIGHVTGQNPGLNVHDLAGLRLHTRTIIRDGRQAFVGSQSLRKAELDSRREVGVIVHETKAVSGLTATFEADWARKKSDVRAHARTKPAVPKKAVKALIKELSPLDPIVKEAVRQVASETESATLGMKEMKETVKEAVQEAVQEAVRDRVRDMVRESLDQA